jgi:hypothetical protein
MVNNNIRGADMFRENTNHRQINFFESSNFMDPSIKKRLDESWAVYFYEHVFCNIDEKPFEVLYSNMGRPNTPVNVLMSLEYIKHMLDYSDDDLIENYYFNYLINFAVGNRVLGERHLCEKTIYDFRNRLYSYALLNPKEVDLIFEQFLQLTLKFAELTKTQFNQQRMDSTMIMSNIKSAGRISLIYDVLVQAIKAMPELLLSEKYKGILKAGFKKDMLYGTKSSQTDSKIDILLKHCEEVLAIAEEHIEYSKSNEIRILNRLYNEQTEINQTTGNKKPKSKHKIESNSLQSAYDEGATYRKKSGKSHVGYSVNIAETCAEDNEIQLITDYTTDKNIKSDVDFGTERIDEIVENTGVEEMYMDGGYYSETLASNEKVEIHFTDMTGREPSEDKIPVADYKIDPENDVISECPAKMAPISTSKKDGNYVAHFDKNTCKNCDLLSKCRILEQVKSTVLRISVKSIESATARQDIKINGLDYTSKRAAIEGTNSELKRAHGLGKLRVRGQGKCSMVVGLKITACNIKRTVKHLIKTAKELLAPPQGISLSFEQ